jgi:hypothetical protein
MSNPFVIAVVALAVAALLLLRPRQSDPVRTHPVHGVEPGAHRDFPMEREDVRIASVSADDRAWETASLQRNRDMTGRAADSAEERA